tara:strand:- start:962 stop:1804 length:843 start_codon:yes stop_codon:yes gene_type:complete
MSSIFFIAEIGINHNGDLNICKKLIDLAKDTGCNAVKFQKRNIDSVYTESFLNSYRESPWGLSQRDQKEGLEFSMEQYKEIDKYCLEKNITWFASAWDEKSQEFLSKLNFKYNKIASPMIVNTSLLKQIAKEKKYTFISTGMCSYNDIDKAVEIFKAESCPYELMHCVSTYPMKDEDANLRMISTLKNKYSCKVGYSGHETGLAISLAAAALGATSIERHITLDRGMYGSDQSASLEPAGLRQLLGGIRKIELSLGDGVKKFTDEEKKVAKKLREHLQIN